MKFRVSIIFSKQAIVSNPKLRISVECFLLIYDTIPKYKTLLDFSIAKTTPDNEFVAIIHFHYAQASLNKEHYVYASLGIILK